jgi:hypothetical protein
MNLEAFPNFVYKNFITPNLKNNWHANPADFGAYQPSIFIISNNGILARSKSKDL